MNKNIKKTPEDMDLSRAVPSMPPSFRRRIQETCENLPERQPIALRRGSIAAAACLAAVILLVLTIDFQRPDSFPDTVTPLSQTTTDNENGNGNSAATAPVENTPSEPAEDASSEAMVDNNVYFFRDSGTWYHLTSNCQGLKDADYGPIDEARQNGRTACPMCIAPVESTPSQPVENSPSKPVNSTPSEPRLDNGAYYYGFDDSEHYHYNKVCQGVEYNLAGPLYLARVNEHTACPICVPTFGAGENHAYYMTDEGAFFHCDENCMGMRNAVAVNARKIISEHRPACSDCVPLTGDRLYWDKDHLCLHADRSCAWGDKDVYETIGLYDASHLTDAKFCPECSAHLDDRVILSSNGYFHRLTDCEAIQMQSGVISTQSMLYLEAIAFMHDPCPACAVYFAPGESTMSEP